MPRVHADLHVHTDRSDGTLSLSAIPRIAHRAEVTVVAVTDHDRLQPGLPSPVSVRESVTLIHGIELRVDAGDLRVDLLGYGVDPTLALQAEVDRLQRNRRERGVAMVDRVEAHLGVELDIELRDGIGRPHIARAIDAHPDASYNYAEAFEHLIGADAPCYVPRELPSYDRGRELLADASALVGLAHPLRYTDPERALTLATELDAIERWYPYDGPVDQAPVDHAIEAYDLIPTGGSDAHDDRLGRAGLSAEAYDTVATRLPSPSTNEG